MALIGQPVVEKMVFENDGLIHVHSPGAGITGVKIDS